MMDVAEPEAAPPPPTVAAYIADMLGQLAQMADAAGRAGWAREIRYAAGQAQAEDEGGAASSGKAGR